MPGSNLAADCLAAHRKAALRGVTIALPAERPHILAVVGESGSGKTTLTRLLLGLQRPTRGRVTYRRPRHRRSSRQRSACNIAARCRRCFRIRSAPTTRSIALIAACCFLRGVFGLARTDAQARELAERALRAVGLQPEETLGRYPHQLSGGQRQRLMVARAVMLRPRVLVADEPVSMVDASLRATILESLWRLRHEQGMSLVYVTHDLATAYQVADEIIVMRDGVVVEAGDPVRVIHHPQADYTRELVASVPPPDPTSIGGWSDSMIRVAVIGAGWYARAKPHPCAESSRRRWCWTAFAAWARPNLRACKSFRIRFRFRGLSRTCWRGSRMPSSFLRRTICTTSTWRPRWRAGAHVLCEKPMTVDPRDAMNWSAGRRP